MNLGYLSSLLLDIDAELNGGTYCRDLGQCALDVYGEVGSKQANGLHDGRVGVYQDQRSDWVETEVLPCLSTKEETKTSTPVSECGSRDSSPTMQRMQEHSGDRRCEGGTGSVHRVWPDPMSGCVYGGLCALFFRQTKDDKPCVHSPVLEIGAFQFQYTTDAGRFQSGDGSRLSIPFASRPRWKRTTERKRVSRAKSLQAVKKVSKAQRTARNQIRRAARLAKYIERSFALDAEDVPTC